MVIQLGKSLGIVVITSKIDFLGEDGFVVKRALDKRLDLAITG